MMPERILIALASGLIGGGIGHRIGYDQGYQYGYNVGLNEGYYQAKKEMQQELADFKVEVKAVVKMLEVRINALEEREKKRDEQLAQIVLILKQILESIPMKVRKTGQIYTS